MTPRLPSPSPVLAAVLAALLAIVQAAPIAAEAPPDLAQEWQLVPLSDTAPVVQATLDLRDPGRAGGRAPCNRWFATATLGTPAASGVVALQFGAIGATRMACDDLAAEQQFFAALARVTAAQIADGSLILTSPAGPLLKFVPVAP